MWGLIVAALTVVSIVLMGVCWQLIQMKRELGVVKQDIQRLTGDITKTINSSLRLIGPFR